MGELTRIESDDGVMLYDPSCVGNFTADWFDPQHWGTRGMLSGQARGRGRTVFFDSDGVSYALRHYRRGGMFASLLGDRYPYVGVSASRPWRELQLMYALHAEGLPVPRPVAARVVRSGALYRGDLITLRLRDTHTLAERLAAACSAGSTLDTSVFAAIGTTIARFHLAGVDHADLNAHNVLFDVQGAVYLLDFDRGRRRQPGLWQDANLVRLRRSILKVCDGLSPALFDDERWAALLLAYRDTIVASARA